jgi:hypothetical protein
MNNEEALLKIIIQDGASIDVLGFWVGYSENEPDEGD